MKECAPSGHACVLTDMNPVDISMAGIGFVHVSGSACSCGHAHIDAAGQAVCFQPTILDEHDDDYKKALLLALMVAWVKRDVVPVIVARRRAANLN